MQQNILEKQISDMVSRAINRLMMLSGTLAFVWILVFLVVALLEN